MGVFVTIEGLDELKSSWETCVSDMGRACGDGVTEAVHVGEQTAKREAPIRSGALRASIHGDVTARNAAGAVGKVGAYASHAASINDGSRAHEIRGNPLAFEVGGQAVFTRRVHHPGTKANHFMDRTAPVVERTLESKTQAGIDTAVAKFQG